MLKEKATRLCQTAQRARRHRSKATKEETLSQLWPAEEDAASCGAEESCEELLAVEALLVEEWWQAEWSQAGSLAWVPTQVCSFTPDRKSVV